MMGILVAALISGLVQLVLHWFPWGVVLGRSLPRLAAYMLGVLGIALPLSGLYWHGGGDYGLALLALWACVLAAGGSVLAAYGLDWIIDRVRRSYEHEELGNAEAGRE